MSVAQRERAALVETMRAVGPDAPTLCEGWKTRDLAAHLMIREYRPDAAPGIMIPFFASRTAKVQNEVAERTDWDELVDKVASGPPVYSPLKLLDPLVNVAEMFIHHEDVRRAQPDWEPRVLEQALVGSLRRTLTLDEVVTAAGRLKDKGFREMKTQLALPGDTSPAKEVERMRRVREAIGSDIKLMCDINQRWRPEQAIDIGRRVEDAGVGLFWLEDVTAHDDYAGIARVNAALATPICGGELVYGIVPFRHMIEQHSVDYVMIDLIRVGGITQWLKVAGMAEAFNLPVVSHVIPEIHAHLVAAVPNGLTVEYMGWMLQLFDGTAALEKSELVLSDRAGLGLAFKEEIIQRFAVAS